MIEYREWISNQKIISFVAFLTDQNQNGSSVKITFEKFMEIKRELFHLYFFEKYIWNMIISNFEHYRDFMNRIEEEYDNYHKKV